MLGSLFLFSGRVGRLRYFLWSLILVPLVFFVSSFVLPLLFALGSDFSSPGAALFTVAIIPLFVFGWVELSLQATRIRDIGWNPWVVVPASFAFSAIHLLLDYAFQTEIFSIVSYVVNLLITLACLFVPTDGNNMFSGFAIPGISLSASGSETSGGNRPKPSANRQPQQSVPGSSRPTYPGEKAPFGRRGLT